MLIVTIKQFTIILCTIIIQHSHSQAINLTLMLHCVFNIDAIFEPSVVICCGGLHSGGSTRHLHTPTKRQKPAADLSYGVGGVPRW